MTPSMKNTRNIARKIRDLDALESEVVLPYVNDTEEVKLLKYDPEIFCRCAYKFIKKKYCCLKT